MKDLCMFYNLFKRIIFSMMTTALLFGCSSTESIKSEENPLFEKMILELSDIRFKKQGISPEGRPYMVNICKGFVLSEDMVEDFFTHAEHISEAEATARFKSLPCYSIGTAQIESEKYNWIIRAGGIGEFYNKDNKFFKICGEQCCKKNQVLC